jgi:hypothetical protein
MDVAVMVLLAAVFGLAITCVVAAVRRGKFALAAVAWLLLLLAAAALFIGISTQTEGHLLDLRGGLVITNPDPNTRVYVGNRLMPSGEAYLSWSDLRRSAGEQNDLMVLAVDPDKTLISPEDVAGQGRNTSQGTLNRARHLRPVILR